MISLFSRTSRWVRNLTVAGGLFLVAACDPAMMGQLTVPGATGTGGTKAQVALLLPKGSPNAQVAQLAASAEKAARLATAGLSEGVEVTIKVYDTAGSTTQAAAMGVKAVNEGADVIVGPLFADAANAVGTAVAGSGVNVLSLSNNVSIAGGNVYVLGNTFENTADRLVSYAFRQGKRRAIIVHARNVAGEAGRAAIAKALSNVGASPVASEGYEPSQQGVVSAMGRAASKSKAAGADVVLITSDYSGALPLVAQLLPEAGVNPATVQYAGLTRWDATPSAFNLPGIQGGWFTVPNTTRISQFNQRYQAAYGAKPHEIASIAFDGVAAVAASVSTGRKDALTGTGLTRSSGFQGASGIFRLTSNGTNQRGLAIATIRGNQMVILDAAPSGFGAGF